MTSSNFLLKNEPNRISTTDLNLILEHCTAINSSDITIQSGEHVIAEVYGKLEHITSRVLTNSEVGVLLNAIYGANGVTQLLSGKDLDTNYEFKPSRVARFRYRVNATACLVAGHPGIQMTLRTIPNEPPFLKDMMLSEDICQKLEPEQGVIYVTGATGSGKTTLLAAIIREIAEKPDCHRKILTYEAPIEFVYDDLDTASAIISQSEIPKHLPSFAYGVRNALRRKPKLILVGEARDPETISAVLDAALTGHPVYTTLHTNGVAETIRRLVGSFSKEERNGKTIDIIETTKVILWQKLVPTTDGKRTALREYLVFNDKVRDELLSVDVDHITAKTRECLAKYGQTMQQSAKEAFNAGLISERTFNMISAKSAE